MRTVVDRTDPRRAEPAAVAVGLGAVLFLLSRPAIAPLGAPVLAAGYVMLCAASLFALPPPAWTRARALAPPVARVRSSDPWIPLAMGAAAVLLVRFTAGAAPPVIASGTVVALNTAAAVAEEAFFRGFLFGRLEGWGVGAAIAGSASAFALIHVPLFGWTAFPVDLGAGLLFAWQRASSGRWTVPAATHALANLLAVLR
jgi:membrane protease YdiL (CAAX protease family)